MMSCTSARMVIWSMGLGRERCGMERAYRYRIYPNAEQRETISRTFGCCRWVYNRGLEIRQDAHARGGKAPSVYDIMRMIPAWTRDEAPWLAEVDSITLRQVLRDLDKAYRNFFRRPGRVGFPRFKSKRDQRRSYRTNANGRNVRIEDDGRHIRLPKLGPVKARVSRIPDGRILSATVTETPTGRYFVSLHCTNCEAEPYPNSTKMVGIDLGVKTEVVCSDDTTFESPKAYAKAQGRLAREQRRLSRKVGARRGERRSANYRRQQRRVALCHERIANQRKDFTNKVTTALVRENQAICVEDLNVSGMVRNHHIAKAVEDASFGELVRQLGYKCAWHGRDFVKVGKFYPSTRTCSCCGHVQDMPLSVRTYRCPECGMVLDRDQNAARNILAEGMRLLGRDTPEAKACGEGTSPVVASVAQAILVEAGIPCL